MDTLWARLEALPDRRTRKGRRYSLASILTLSIAAMLCGADDLLAIHRFGRRLTPKGLEMLGIRHGKSPAHATLHYVFAAIAAEELGRVLLGAAVKQSSAGGPRSALGHVALDGKRLRGSAVRSGDGERPGVHVLSAFASELRRSIGALIVPPDSGEMVEALRLIRDLPIGPGDVITGDAAFTYRDIVHAIREKRADYLLFVKANQPDLETEIAERFGDLSPLGPAPGEKTLGPA
jgi:hypothetical protein